MPPRTDAPADLRRHRKLPERREDRLRLPGQRPTPCPRRISPANKRNKILRSRGVLIGERQGGSMKTFLYGCCLALVALFGLALAAGASGQTITEFSAGITAGAQPLGITAGPDGNLWFTERAGP